MLTPFRRPTALALAVGLAAGACAPQASATPTLTPSQTAAPTAAVTGTPSPTPTATAACPERVLASMSQPQRVGQLFLLGLANDQLGAAEVDAIRTRHLGSVWFVEQSSAGVSGIRAVADAVQSLVGADTTANVRFYVAANQEGGIIQSLKGPGFSAIPTAVDQGTLAPDTLQQRATQWGQELAAAGVNLNFAPVLDVVPPGTDAQNEPIGVLKRGYGHDPTAVSTHGMAFLRGMAAAGITTTAKHFPGLGRVKGNTDFTAAVVDESTTIDDAYLAPFRDAIAAGVPFVMVALATYTRIDAQHLAAFSSTVMRQLLRDRLGFTGAIVSDDLGATAAVATIPPGQRAIDFLTAGGDLVISKTVAPAIAMADAIVARAGSDAAFQARVDDAALRVLRAKQASGLLRCS